MSIEGDSLGSKHYKPQGLMDGTTLQKISEGKRKEKEKSAKQEWIDSQSKSPKKMIKVLSATLLKWLIEKESKDWLSYISR